MDKLRDTYGRTILRILNSGIVPNYVDPEEEPQFFGAAGTGVWFKPPDGVVTNLADDDMALVSNAHVINSAAVLFVNHPEWGSLRLPAEAIGALRHGDKSMIVVRGIRSKIAKLKKSQSKFATDLEAWFEHVQEIGPLPFPTRDMLPQIVDKECAVIGFPLNQANQVITRGVVSSNQLFQVSEDQTLLLFQTDAAMNHGNSGGAMVVELGGVVYYVGIPSLGIPDASNVGYVLPAHHVASTMSALIADPRSKVNPTRRLPKEFLNVEGPYRGFESVFVQGEVDGFVVTSIDDCPFDLQPGDTITQIGTAVVGDDGLLQLPWTDVRVPFGTAFDELDLSEQTAQITVMRGGEEIILSGEWMYDVNLPIRQRFGALEPIKYEAFDGMVISELNLDQVEAIPLLEPFKLRTNRLVPRLAVITVDSLVPSAVRRGWIVEEVNGVAVQTYEEWRALFEGSAVTNKISITFNTLRGSSKQLKIEDLSKAIQKTVQLSRVNNERITDGVDEIRFIERERRTRDPGPSVL